MARGYGSFWNSRLEVQEGCIVDLRCEVCIRIDCYILNGSGSFSSCLVSAFSYVRSCTCLVEVYFKAEAPLSCDWP
jgi:hypothetical protein